MCNPFSPLLDPNKLICLKSGMAVNDHIASQLLEFKNTGKKWMNEFIDDCKSDPKQFEKRLPRRQVPNFNNGDLKIKVKGKDLQIMELKFSRDMFGELLVLCLEHQFSLRSAVEYPLLPVPLMLGHMIGTMCTTPKSSFVKVLEPLVEPLEEFHPDIVLLDFMFLLKSETSNLPKTYGEIARHLLKKTLNLGSNNAIVVCDPYWDGPSIKDMCHDVRGQTEGDRLGNQFGRGQTRPSDMNTALSSKEFKILLINFIIGEWKESCGDLLVGKNVSFAFRDKCYTYMVS